MKTMLLNWQRRLGKWWAPHPFYGDCADVAYTIEAVGPGFVARHMGSGVSDILALDDAAWCASIHALRELRAIASVTSDDQVEAAQARAILARITEAVNKEVAGLKPVNADFRKESSRMIDYATRRYLESKHPKPKPLK